ncbi:sigma-70 family RNA polymerase sigma factor [Myxococcus sp. RHSTA-1-4]|uniref:sigma-70 family RNA polymerase sigma factor n=1 Tax=Myxococcus sp. RHSTA-1-4 TaxID=2874601 RepID=UPI001CC06301|nr:sigma-70 family RNA polymerase sigma factor [Myxococcus sp. RHSTA-1-4]MBZ4417969.1 sigma-70 family RNA polymerase sigma factor [Myxococcus sp. RHSTA-1-4]
MAFAPTFLAHTGWHVEGAADLECLERLLLRFWREGRDQWPDIPLSSDAFVCHLAAHSPRLEPGDDFERLLAQLVPGDLYLACACARGIPAALSAFERHHIADVPATLAHMKLPEAVVDDIRQQVRERLLVRTDEAPKIEEYSGRGPLSNWVRVVSLRTALSLLRTTREEGSVSDAILDLLPDPDGNPETEAIQRRYQDEFRQAMEDAFAALPSRQKYLLRLHFVDRLSTTRIGALFNVNQSTASRWLRTAQQEVHDATRRILKERLDLSSREFTSVLRAVESQLDLSISRILAEG